MTLHCFTIPALSPDAAQAEVNAFCAGQRVLRLDRHFVADGAQSFWALCVEVAAGPGPLPDALKRSARKGADAGMVRGAKTQAPDYKQLLSEADFAVFAALRDWRKAQAEAEGVPLYAVFTNEQLATVAQQRCGSLAALGQIDGVGTARLQRYGGGLLQHLTELVGLAPAQAAAAQPGQGEGVEPEAGT